MLAPKTKPNANKPSPEKQSPFAGDLLPHDLVWTPEIEQLVLKVAMWIRLEGPGGTAYGPQRNGKTSACEYLGTVLPDVLALAIITIRWTMPDPPAQTDREWIQQRLAQSGCEAVIHRDKGVLQGRLIEHLIELASAAGTRHILIVIDEAQNMTAADFGRLIYLHNLLIRERIRPFALLVGQPELRQIASSWTESGAHQVVGRFFACQHGYRGIRADDFEQVLEQFDTAPEDPAKQSIGSRFQTTYDTGWRLPNLGAALRDAITTLQTRHNFGEPILLPMQYFRSTLIAILYRCLATGLSPQMVDSKIALQCLGEAGFTAVLGQYVKKKEKQ